MFRWFTRSPRPAPTAARPRVRLALERLEARACPSWPFLITSFTASVQVGHVAQLSGTVQDDYPASVQLTFSGAVTGTTSADATGHFSYSTTNAVLGTVNAAGVDGANNTAAASATLSKALPTLTMSVTYNYQTNVTLSGVVTDLDQGGRSVSFSGKVSGSTTTYPNGNYSYTGNASGLGTVTGTVTDAWGQSGSTTITLSAAAPVIYGFAATQGTSNYWTFAGDVTATNAPGMTVSFSGMSEFNSSTNTTVASNDTFSESVQLGTGEYATVTATVTDWWGQIGTATTTVQT